MSPAMDANANDDTSTHQALRVRLFADISYIAGGKNGTRLHFQPGYAREK